jgi:5-methylcytosine-specific restriction endonuclease McrA
LGRRYRRKSFFSRPRRKRANALGSLIFAILFISVAVLLVEGLIGFWGSSRGKIVISSVLGLAALRAAWNQAKARNAKAQMAKAIAEVEVSDRREDYIIERDDYRRGNPKENAYRKQFFLPLLETFGNRCAKCLTNDNGMDIDHFFLSKNEGGCFIMRHVNGHLVNNAVPLCQSCNRGKSDESYRDFFTQAEALALFQKCANMTKRLNERPILAADGTLIKTLKKRAIS